jgi:hypothetical protein
MGRSLVSTLALLVAGCALVIPLDDLRSTSGDGGDGSDGGGKTDGGGSALFIQGKAVSDYGGGSQVSWSTTLVLPQVQAHDALVVGITAFQVGSPLTAITVTDDRGDVFTSTDIVQFSGYTNALIACAFDVAGGDTTISIALEGPKVEGDDAVVLEYQSVSSLDAWVGRGGGDDTTDGMSSGTAPTSSAGDVIVGIGYTSGKVAPGTGFTQRELIDTGQFIAEDRTASAAGSQGATATMTGPTDYWLMMMAALKP